MQGERRILSLSKWLDKDWTKTGKSMSWSFPAQISHTVALGRTVCKVVWPEFEEIKQKQKQKKYIYILIIVFLMCSVGKIQTFKVFKFRKTNPLLYPAWFPLIIWSFMRNYMNTSHTSSPLLPLRAGCQTSGRCLFYDRQPELMLGLNSVHQRQHDLCC